MNGKTMSRYLFQFIFIAFLAVALAACSTDSVPEAPEASEPDLQTEACY